MLNSIVATVKPEIKKKTQSMHTDLDLLQGKEFINKTELKPNFVDFCI